MNWKSYISKIEQVFLNPWYSWGDEETQLDPHYAEFNISDFKYYVNDYLEGFGIERYWNCRDCNYYRYDSDWNETTWESYGWHECDKRPQNNNLKSFPFDNAPQKCFVPSFWVTSYSKRYHGRDEDEQFKKEYADKYKGYKRS
jgi:hypothetical protein